jgi:hypothetical protein
VWTIAFDSTYECWSQEDSAMGGTPAGADLDAMLRGWFQENGGPAARWRLRVSLEADESNIVAETILIFTETVERKVRRLGPDRGPVARTFDQTTILLPPSPEQLAAWATRGDPRT